MGRFVLSKTDDWTLVHDDQDIRGWPVQDRAGTKLGTVAELIANSDSELVESIVLDTGREYPAREIDLGDGVVFIEAARAVGTDADPVVKKYGNARIARREAVMVDATDFDDHRSVFQQHCRTTFNTDDDGFSTYEPAYRFGYASGSHADYRDRDYADVETDLRRRFEDRHGEGTFKTMGHAVKYGFNHARSR